MTCHEARECFTDLLDDVLDAPARADLTAHLAGCGDCRAELECLRQTISLLHGLEAPRAPAGFVDRVMAGTSPRVLDPASRAQVATRPVERAPRRRFFFRLPVDLPAGVAAFLLVAVGVGFLVTRAPELEEAGRVASQRTAALSAPDRGDGDRESIAEHDARSRALVDRASSPPPSGTATAPPPSDGTTPATVPGSQTSASPPAPATPGSAAPRSSPAPLGSPAPSSSAPPSVPDSPAIASAPREASTPAPGT
jgi:hypothetical protein